MSYLFIQILIQGSGEHNLYIALDEGLIINT